MTASDLDLIRGYLADHSDADVREVLDALDLTPTAARRAAVETVKSNVPTGGEGYSRDENPSLEADRAASPEPQFHTWGDVDFSSTESDTYPPELLGRERWMGRLEGTKTTFAPWADRDHTETDVGEDVRYKWGYLKTGLTGRPSRWPQLTRVLMVVCSFNSRTIDIPTSTATMSGVPRRVRYTPRLSPYWNISA